MFVGRLEPSCSQQGISHDETSFRVVHTRALSLSPPFPDYMEAYRNISAKLKKRFMRKVNTADAAEQFRGLAHRLQQDGNSDYGGFCCLAAARLVAFTVSPQGRRVNLAAAAQSRADRHTTRFDVNLTRPPHGCLFGDALIARCEQATRNPTAEAEHLTQAAQYFVEAEADDRQVDELGFEDNIIDAVQCYEQAVEIYLRVQRASFAATLYIELAGVLRVFGRTEQAADYFQRAATLLADSPLPCIEALNEACTCQVSRRRCCAADGWRSLFSLGPPSGLVDG